jgi:hypothetical protein
MTQLVIKDSGQLKIFRGLEMSITGGVHAEQGSDQHDNGPLDVFEVAAVNEFGGGRIPARMWLRGWVSRNRTRIVADIRRVMQDMARRQDYRSAPFEQVTEDVMKSLQDQILSGSMRPANAKSTLANKAPETRPLFEFGQLVHAIRGRLRAKNDSGSIAWRSEQKR